LKFHGLFNQEITPVEIVEIGPALAKVKLLYWVHNSSNSHYI